MSQNFFDLVNLFLVARAEILTKISLLFGLHFFHFFSRLFLKFRFSQILFGQKFPKVAIVRWENFVNKYIHQLQVHTFARPSCSLACLLAWIIRPYLLRLALHVHYVCKQNIQTTVRPTRLFGRQEYKGNGKSSLSHALHRTVRTRCFKIFSNVK